MKVIFGDDFGQKFKHFPKADKVKIFEFASHIEQFGFVGLQGRNKSSDNVPKNDPNWLAKVRYAQEYHLWHYHIGIPDYQLSKNGDYTSEYVLHYRRFDDKIIIVAMSSHPPLELPDVFTLTF